MGSGDGDLCEKIRQNLRVRLLINPVNGLSEASDRTYGRASDFKKRKLNAAESL